jgi:KUP system potassium uptake protein
MTRAHPTRRGGADAAHPDRPTPPGSAGRTAGGSAGHGRGPLIAVSIAALGVVFGDIGTSPLYALKTVFLLDGGAVRATESDVLGVISLMFWSITIIVSIKYLGILMRADNDGEGGVMALAALAQRLYAKHAGKAGILLVIGIVGVSLFYGDSIITPAISVLSAVEGLHVTVPAISHLVIPIAAVILVGLFLVQRYGTGRVGVLFGPIMVLWFVVLAAAGLGMVIQYPSMLLGLSPTYAVVFIFSHPSISFIALGAVVLVITGAEALYADMGHFGRSPIRRSWFFLVFPALTINYLGQAALILHHPEAKSNPFFLLIPEWGRLPVVILATAATVIASQAVISGAFSLSRQAVQLGLLPPLTVRQTSKREGGQIYMPAINALLFIGVMAVMLAFGSSDRLSTAYGISVTGALVVDTLLLVLVARPLWGWGPWKMAAAAIVFGGLELAFLAGNLSKIVNGGWVPLLIAAVVILIMTTWRRGRQLVQEDRKKKEGSLEEFIEDVRKKNLPRVPGIAIFPHPNKDSTPLALRANVEHNHVLHENVIIVSVTTAPVPHVTRRESFAYDDLGYADDGIEHLSIRFGFSDKPDIPRALRAACYAGVLPLRARDFADASYFISRGAIRTTRTTSMVRWRRSLFVGLPALRTVTMGSDVEI